MNSDFAFGQYLPIHSPFHRLNAGIKILALFGLAVAISFLKSIFLFSALAILCGTCFFLARIPGPVFLSFLKKCLVVSLLTFLLSAFLTPGHPIIVIRFLPVSITVEGVYAGVVFSFRALLLLALVSLLLWSTSPAQILTAFESVPGRRIRRRMKTAGFVLMLSLTFVPVLIEEARRIFIAQRARCGFKKSSFPWNVVDISRITIPLISAVLRKSELLARALRLRGYEV
ncbi:MAG: energy-coupling factor transporter transmembrane component T [Candidatus Eisenbacteria bacterium]|nr:energy-coupling factor transporter transmembrane component T [Candidatus Eisenbacteria bacterium]